MTKPERQFSTDKKNFKSDADVDNRFGPEGKHHHKRLTSQRKQKHLQTRCLFNRNSTYIICLAKLKNYVQTRGQFGLDAQAEHLRSQSRKAFSRHNVCKL